MTAYTIAWEEGLAAWTEAAHFFARVISLDSRLHLARRDPNPT